MTTETLHWFKSSYSENGGQCVEIAADLAASHGVVPVRDSKNRNGSTLGLTAHAFSAFITGIKSGDLQAR